MVDFEKRMHKIGSGLKNLFRGMQGLPPEGDDMFSGMIEVKDIRERTRVTTHEAYAHAYMRILKDKGGEEWAIMEDIAQQEDKYFIAIDGEQRKEAILMQRAKTEVRLPGQPLALQPVDTTKPLEGKQEEKKK